MSKMFMWPFQVQIYISIKFYKRFCKSLNKVKNFVLADRNVEILIFANEIGTSEAVVFKTLHDDLG